MITGTTEHSRLQELRKYTIAASFYDQYVMGGSWTQDGVSTVGTILGIQVRYYIGGIQYTDYFIGENAGMTYFTYDPDNTGNFVDVPYYKNMNREKILGKPKIRDDVFIIRTEQTAFDKNYRLEYIRNLVDLTTYAGGSFFNIINNS